MALFHLLLSYLIFFILQNMCLCDTNVHNMTAEQTETNGTISSRSLEELCKCQPQADCISPATAEEADIRIVTPPLGLECASGLVYCCFPAKQHCGLRHNLSSPAFLPGQSKFGEYPWQALIVNLDNDYISSGVIIDEKHIITAAHKVATCAKEDLVVRLGEWDVRSEREPLKPLDVRVTAIAVHPLYDSRTLAYDLAVLSLSQKLRLYPEALNINSICMPTPTTTFHGQNCWVSGWGKDMFGPGGNYQSVLKAVDVMVVKGDDCQSQLQTTRLGRHFKLDQTSFLCAGGQLNKDACTGDGGSPLVCEGVDGHWTLAGLVAWGIGCAQPGVPGVYVNVASMVPWLLQQQSSAGSTGRHKTNTTDLV